MVNVKVVKQFTKFELMGFYGASPYGNGYHSQNASFQVQLLKYLSGKMSDSDSPVGLMIKENYTVNFDKPIVESDVTKEFNLPEEINLINLESKEYLFTENQDESDEFLEESEMFEGDIYDANQEEQKQEAFVRWAISFGIDILAGNDYHSPGELYLQEIFFVVEIDGEVRLASISSRNWGKEISVYKMIPLDQVKNYLSSLTEDQINGIIKDLEWNDPSDWNETDEVDEKSESYKRINELRESNKNPSSYTVKSVPLDFLSKKLDTPWSEANAFTLNGEVDEVDEDWIKESRLSQLLNVKDQKVQIRFDSLNPKDF